MGIIPKPDEHGADCLACFPPGQTPSYVKCFFGGIGKGRKWVDTLPIPPNGYWDLTYNEPGSCSWTLKDTPGLTMGWSPAVVGPFSWLRVRAGIPPFVFSGNVAGNCKRYFENGIVDWFNNWYVDGYGMVCTPAEMQSWIELAMPVVGPNPRMELFPMEDNQIVIRFANKHENTNMKLRINVDDLGF